ncbi:MAG: hypothetical protein ACOZIN_19005 [Myxococcota bacterium]
MENLNDDGPGSLRAALESDFPRTILFRTGGTIELSRDLVIASPFVTVAGQTAPGHGVTLKNASLVIQTHDVLVRYLRVRPGDGTGPAGEDRDGIKVLGRDSGGETYNVVIDHVSVSWATDENISIWYDAHDVTVSSSIIAEGLYYSIHPEKPHSMGLITGPQATRISLLRNLMFNNNARNPFVTGGALQVVNNVIVNWGVLGTDARGREQSIHANIVGNSYLPGVRTNLGGSPLQLYCESDQYHLSGNEGRFPDGSLRRDWELVTAGGGLTSRAGRAVDLFAAPQATVLSAAEAFEAVVGQSGARVPFTDPVDQRIVVSTRGQEGEAVSSPQDVGGYPSLEPGAAPLDRDSDGIPDGDDRLPEDSENALRDLNGDGYNELEEYIDGLLPGAG